MITTVTLNTALDIIYNVPSLRVDQVHRLPGITVPGGKGINAARVIHILGESVTATGFIAGFNGQKMQHLLQQEGVACECIEAQGETRLAITVLDQAQHTQTEFIEQASSYVTAESLTLLEQKIQQLSSRSSWVLFSGSIPQGCPPDLYATLIQIAQASGARTALDASGEALHYGIQACPDLVKPNEDEACAWAGIAPADSYSDQTLNDVLTSMLDHGVKTAAISLGKKGAIAAQGNERYRLTVPPLDIISALGSGDAMAAGMVTAASRGADLAEMLRYGSACGSACALQQVAGKVNLHDVEQIYEQIKISPE